MDDLNFLHSTFDHKDGQNTQEKDKESLESFGLNPRIIVVEDDKILGLSIKKYLMKTLDCQVELYTSSIDCLAELLNNPNRTEQFCLVTDISLEAGADGLLLIDNLKEKGFNFVSIAMTGFASIENAIAATKKGVYHYLTKPFELESLQKLIINAISDKLGVKVNRLNGKSDQSFGKLNGKTVKNVKIEAPTEDDMFCGMIGRSKEMKQVFERIQKVALTESTVLITGPSGTGKELVAGAIHNLSSRHRNNKVSVNCGAMDTT
jgi:DNA-binding NtrC family response regulator